MDTHWRLQYTNIGAIECVASPGLCMDVVHWAYGRPYVVVVAARARGPAIPTWHRAAGRIAIAGAKHMSELGIGAVPTCAPFHRQERARTAVGVFVVVASKFAYVRHQEQPKVPLWSVRGCYFRSAAATLGKFNLRPCLALASRWLPGWPSPNSCTSNCLDSTWHPNLG